MQSVLTEPLTATGLDPRHQVQLALQSELMGGYLQQLFGDASERHAPECRILDMKLEPGDYCTILYQFGERMLIGAYRWGEAEGELPPTAQLIAPLGMQVYRFEHDPALPGLATALDSQAMAAVLREALPEYREGEARILRCRATPLRYRPGKRCTLRFDIAQRDAQGRLGSRRLFGKVYHQLDKAASVYREMQMLADSEPARNGRVVLAPVAAFLPDLKIILQAPVSGVPLELYLEGLSGAVTAGDRRGWDGIMRSADAFAAVHTAGLATDRERPIDSELKRFVKRANQAAAIDAAIGARMIELAEALPAWRKRLPDWGEQITLVHGDCKHSQCMITPEGVAILDFDHCGMADPATDIGTYIATLRQMAIHQALKARGGVAAEARTHWLRALEDQFLEAYRVAAGFDERFLLRARWYEAVALMRKALRGFARAPRSPMPLAQVEEGWRVLEQLPA
ncbi:MAG TPA: phosphotransferase [Roseiflexaceae bacterium]|nr:phosphotransferase [Roseiflexaceae bacterium]